jgi:hypothetical protein
MTTVNEDVDTIVSDPSEPITLENGSQVVIERLRTRQLMSLLKILSKGFGDSIGTLFAAINDEQEEDFVFQLLGAMFVAIPDSENETIEFVNRMVSPASLIEDPRTKAERGANEEARERLTTAMQNPELEDLFAIIERIIQVEGPHVQALGKRLSAMISVTNRTRAESN